MDKTSVASPVIFRLRIGQRDVPGKVFVLRLQPVKVFFIEYFTQRAYTVPEGDLALQVQAFELIKNV